MADSFRVYQSGIDALARSPWMVEQMRKRAERGRDYARQIAPVRTGRYFVHFWVDAGVKDNKAYGLLYNDVRALDGKGLHDDFGYPYSLALEFGTRYMKPQRILRRSLDVMAR